MGLIIETDLGRDPDDFFAICYLISAGVEIEALFITPGDSDQIAIGKFLSKYLGKNFPVIASQENRTKKSSGNFHYQILEKYGYPLTETSDIIDIDIEDKDLFIIGPPTKLGNLIVGKKVNNITVQGGFLGYDIHNLPCQRLSKFENKDTVSTFNLGGARQQSLNLANHNLYNTKKFISKNLCHTIIYNEAIHELVCSYDSKNLATELLRYGMDKYLEKHKDGKKFHDPTAAVCSLHPEIATWVKGKLYNTPNNEWGTVLDENGYDIIVDINRKELWEYIARGI